MDRFSDNIDVNDCTGYLEKIVFEVDQLTSDILSGKAEDNVYIRKRKRTIPSTDEDRIILYNKPDQPFDYMESGLIIIQLNMFKSIASRTLLRVYRYVYLTDEQRNIDLSELPLGMLNCNEIYSDFSSLLTYLHQMTGSIEYVSALDRYYNDTLYMVKTGRKVTLVDHLKVREKIVHDFLDGVRNIDCSAHKGTWTQLPTAKLGIACNKIYHMWYEVYKHYTFKLIQPHIH